MYGQKRPEDSSLIWQKNGKKGERIDGMEVKTKQQK
jgi:hypothetical protein